MESRSLSTGAGICPQSLVAGATASVAASDDVQFRVQVADGTANGDLIEAGIGDVSICE